MLLTRCLNHRRTDAVPFFGLGRHGEACKKHAEAISCVMHKLLRFARNDTGPSSARNKKPGARPGLDEAEPTEASDHLPLTRPR